MPLMPSCHRSHRREWGLVGLVAGGLLFLGSTTNSAAEPTVAQTRAAQQIFTRVCTQCHGADGKGTPGRPTLPVIPDFTNAAWQQSRSNIQLMISILDGKDRLMPPNRGLVSEDLARALVAKVRSFGPAAAVAVAPPTKPAPEPITTPGKPRAGSTIVVPEFAPTGDFTADFDNLSRRFDALSRQAHEAALVSVAPAPPPSVPVPPPTITPTPPVAVAPVAPPPSAVQPEPLPEKPVVASLPISERPFTADDVAHGRELFLGRRPLANHGTACVACHAVNHGAARDGGRLGPDLTKAYERLGGRTGLEAHLWSPTSRTMRPAYREHALQPDEVLSLTAYLADADTQAAEESSPVRLKFVLLGVGGAVLGLGAFSSLWASRSRRAGS